MAEVEREAALLAAAGPEADRPRRGRSAAGAGFALRVPRLAPAAVAAALLRRGRRDRRRRRRSCVGERRAHGRRARSRGAPGATLQLELNGDEARG